MCSDLYFLLFQGVLTSFIVLQVICIHDLSSVYRVPILMEGQGLVEYFNERLHLNLTLPQPKQYMQKWRNLAER